MKPKDILPSRMMARRGQVTSEYLVAAMAVLIAVAVIGTAARYRCIRDATGDLEECRSLTRSVANGFRSSVEDITFLINLPF